MKQDTLLDLPCEECGFPLADHGEKNICPERCFHCGEWSFDCRCGGSATLPKRCADRPYNGPMGIFAEYGDYDDINWSVWEREKGLS